LHSIAGYFSLNLFHSFTLRLGIATAEQRSNEGSDDESVALAEQGTREEKSDISAFLFISPPHGSTNLLLSVYCDRGSLTGLNTTGFGEGSEACISCQRGESTLYRPLSFLKKRFVGLWNDCYVISI
jgi:hypothetical protein